jgi:uncharacterized protein YndB with AHSA1/START domain
MSDPGQSFQVLAIRFERLLPGPAERVWQHLTECDKLSGWFGSDGTLEPRAGGRVNFMGGHIRGVVTQWRPPRRLVYTWNVFSPGETESAYPESYLTFDLEEQRAGQVRLTFVHFPILERFEKQNAMGWHTFLDILDATLRGEPVEPRGVYMKRNAARYGVDLNNLQR